MTGAVGVVCPARGWERFLVSGLPARMDRLVRFAQYECDANALSHSAFPAEKFEDKQES